MWSRPRKPQRNPNPSANEVSGSYVSARVVELQLVQRVPQLGVVVGVGREQPGEDHRLHLLVAGERLGAAPACERDRVADASPWTSFSPVTR